MKRSLPFLFLFIVLSNYVQAQQTNLYIIDPQNPWYWAPATIEEAAYVIQPKGFYTQADLYMTISGREAGFPDQSQLEIIMDFQLPDKAMVIDSWLWVEDVIIRAKILDRWTASGIYEEIVDRRQDPSILFKNSATQHQLRIYPLPGNGSRRIKLSFLLPAQWSSSEVRTSLPMDFLQLSSPPLSSISIRNFPEEGWEDLRLAKMPERDFVSITDTLLGQYQELTVPNIDFGQQLTLVTEAPFQQGLFLSKLEEKNGQGGYYQMALLPSQVFDLPKTQSKKILMLFDYQDNRSPQNQQELLMTARNHLKSNLLPADSFNLMLSALTISPVSENWLPAEPEIIDSVFNTLGTDPIASYSSVPSLLGNGIQYITRRGSEGTLLLMANSNNEGEVSVANQLINDLMELMAEKTIPIHVFDFQTFGLTNFWINNRSYRGNEYFYTNLTRLTAGNLIRQFSSSKTFGENMGIVMEGLSSFTGTLDLHTSLAEGLCYNRFNLTGEPELVNLNKPILQIGRYQGNFPFSIEAAGAYDGLLFGESMTVEAADIVNSDSLLEEAWIGNYIRTLERGEQSNSIISEIINRSIDGRVLSLYTAFIALEPGLGGEPCPECVDQTGRDVATDVEDMKKDSIFRIQAFPNPFADRVIIELRAKDQLELSDIQFAIFNTLGQEVYRFTDISQGRTSELRLEWDAQDSNGQPVAEGIYFFTMQTPQQRVVYRLVKLGAN